MLAENRTVQLAAIPLRGQDGLLWNQLHDEREEICESLLNISGRSSLAADLAALQMQLKRVDDILDELMTGQL